MKTNEQFLLEEKYDGVKTDEFFTDCKALALGTPLGYLIGHVPFLDCTIYLDHHPLVPRVETEYWADLAIKAMQERSKLQSTLAGLPSEPICALDLCAGSGCIGVAVAKALSRANVDFGEIDARLLPTIDKNIATNCPTSSTHVYHSNLFAGIPTENCYDFILSNPPYIDPALDRATESVKTHEPHLALYGGVGGLDVIEQIIASASQYLTPTGQLWIEHEPEQSAAIKAIADQHNFVATTHLDQYQVERYSILVVE